MWFHAPGVEQSQTFGDKSLQDPEEKSISTHMQQLYAGEVLTIFWKQISEIQIPSGQSQSLEVIVQMFKANSRMRLI